MRLGVIADVHANLHALDAVLEHLSGQGVDRIVCLGDLVGYGPRPNEVIARIVEADIPTVLGNHDQVAAGLEQLDRCSTNARSTLEWTRSELTEDSRNFLAALPRKLPLEEGIVAAHGSLEDPWTYVRRVADALEQLELLDHEPGSPSVLLLGHTHRQMVVSPATKSAATSEGLLARSSRRVTVARPLFVNPGAVGQSRELRPLARCCLLDTLDHSVRLFALRYPQELNAEDLRRLGLPPRWGHAKPTWMKTVRQVLRDSEDRRTDLGRQRSADVR